MKHLGKLGFGLMALALTACSADEPNVNPGMSDQDNAKDVFATLTLRLPAGDTRANNGIEVGQNSENRVGKILVVLATKDKEGQFKYLTRSESDAKPNSTGVETNTLKYVLNFSAKEMDPNPLDKDEAGQPTPGSGIPGAEVYVFTYCNPSAALLDMFSNVTPGDNFTNFFATINDKDKAAMWEANKFLMTNCEISDPVVIPKRDDLIDKHHTPETAFSLGQVRVKRAAARFDFALGGDKGDNKYSILDIDGSTIVGEVELTQMALFNIAKNFYYLPRTNEAWTWKGKTTLCGDLEGFVMSYNGNNFRTASSLSSLTLTNYFFSPLIGSELNEDENLDWVSIRPADWTGTADNDENWTMPGGTSKPDYRIWRYTTENTIPASENGGTSSQKVGISTGVAFKGEFKPVNTTRWNGNVVYVHDNIVYGDLTELKEYVSKNGDTKVAADFAKVSAFSKATGGSTINLLKNVSENDRFGFKAYEPDGNGKYIMYYFYYNRHASNGNPSLMGENEFGVVRNNVYKLQVTTCNRLGAPESPNRPDDPNEEENAYFTVSCLVMPWTVRVNNIEF